MGTARGSTQMTTPDVINARFDNPERRVNYYVNGRPPNDPYGMITGTEEHHWTTTVNEPVFRFKHITRQSSLCDGNMLVLPTLNGLDYSKIWQDVAYAGCSVQSVNYAKNKPIAVKQSGKAKLLHTGSAPIHAGEWVELYAMDHAEAHSFKRKHDTQRIMAGLRSVIPGTGQFDEDYASFVLVYDAIPRRPRLDRDYLDCEKIREAKDAGGNLHQLLKLIDRYRAERQTQIIGKALGNAVPGQYFECLLSQLTPG